MAEIKIEKKTPIWPWLLVGLLLLALILYFAMRDDREDGYVAGDRDRDTTEQRVENREGAVSEYVHFVESDSMGDDHQYTREAFSRLVRAVRAKADEVNHDISADLAQAEENVNRITNDPNSTTHANSIKNASEKLTQAMGNLQQAKFDGLNNEMQRVREASNSINPQTLALNQRNEIKSFLSNSADLLKKMN
jgi:hypothetical protein